MFKKFFYLNLCSFRSGHHVNCDWSGAAVVSQFPGGPWKWVHHQGDVTRSCRMVTKGHSASMEVLIQYIPIQLDYIIKECMYGTFDCQNSRILYTAYLCLKMYGVMHETRALFVSAVAYTNEWLCSCNLVSIPLGISVVPVYIPVEPSHCVSFYFAIGCSYYLNLLIGSYFYFAIGCS